MLKELDIELKYEDDKYGAYITSIKGFEQKEDEKGMYYWSYYIDEVYATTGVSSCNVEDGKKYPSICYPSAQTIANSWDKDVAKNVGISLASDCIDNNIDIILGPGINVKRTPLCGRNFEYYSEDPYLTSELSSEYVLGVQNQGVLACLKHFCANNREYDRNFQSSEVDMRTLREIYTKAFGGNRVSCL